ncbi:MAG: hypothetical protein PUG43_05395 [Clostridiales bacterium]|nr:hypothetical protein [Clostridiales bacterium]MDD7347935.1 hypothetical protein [Clostridiales bacterium]MDY4060749.1 hypothetical protein [Anaerovoracaceae bacterium]
MNRPDGYKLKGCDPFYEIMPHIMPHRYDATNYIHLDIDMDSISKYVNQCREKGIAMKHMSVVIAAYLRLVSQNPHLNRFVINRTLYSRNHFAVSFIAIKPVSENGNNEEAIKLYFNLDDDIFEVNRKVSKAIEETESASPDRNNAADRFLQGLNKVPGLMRGIIGFLKTWDSLFGLPFSIIDASPFHTSLFITNLASIRLGPVYHHMYDFGSTSLFIAMGTPEKKLTKVGETIVDKKVIPVNVSADDRVASGYYYARCFREYKRYMANPSVLEKKPDKIVRDENVKVRNPKFIVK